MTQIELRGIEKFFGPVQVIKNLNLAIADNEFIVLLGQSGCGKTTTLRAIAGLETVDQGDILIDGGNRFGSLLVAPRAVGVARYVSVD